MSYDELKQIISESSLISGDQKVIVRSYDDLDKLINTSKPIKILTGIRRSGKSFILKKIFNKAKLITSPNNLLFINFEHPLLEGKINLTELLKVYDLFLSQVDKTKPMLVFLDEIQNIKGWEKFVRTIYDSTSVNIFITGSNSRLLSSEYTTVLGGRYLEFHILPFNFSEFLEYNNLIVKDSFKKVELRNEILGKYKEFVEYGGIPEAILLETPFKLQLKHSLVEKILLKDIIERFSLYYPQLLRSILRYLERNVGNIVSAGNIMNSKDKNLEYDEKTITKYLEYLEQSYLVRKVEKFDIKTKAIFNTQKKYYFTDNIFTEYSNYSDKVENLVYTSLLRKYENQEDIYFGKAIDGSEIDFIVAHRDIKLKIQVCSELNPQNIKREIKTLLNSDSEYQKILIYEELRDIKEEEYPEIKFIQITNWLLDL